MSNLTLQVTNAGRAALINAAHTGTAPVTITHCGVSATAVAPTPAITSLQGEIKRISTMSGEAVASDTIHLIVRDESSDTFTMRSFALYLADGTLFAIYGQPAAILEKSAQSLMLLAVDIKFEDIAAEQIVFGALNFLNPPATKTVQGVVELATETEATTGVDDVRATTPKGVKTAVTSWINDRFGQNAPTALVKSILAMALTADIRAALAIKSAALKDEGAGKGLDADLLDGQHGAYYADIPARLGFNPLNATAYTAADILAKLLAVDGAGSGIDADLLDGQQGSYYTAIAARLGYTPLNAASYTAADVLAKLLTVDGPGSGVDADTVDGLHAASFLLASQFTSAQVLALLLSADGAGSGLDADLLDGQQGSYYSNIPARLGFTPLNAASYTPADVLAKLLTVDGPGSGVDADLLDGAHLADLVKQIDFTQLLAGTGYQIFPGGLCLQWRRGTGGFSETSQTVTWPLAFQQIFDVFVTCAATTASTSADSWYQVIGTPGLTSCVIMRQTSYNAGSTSTTPVLLAFGRIG